MIVVAYASDAQSTVDKKRQGGLHAVQQFLHSLAASDSFWYTQCSSAVSLWRLAGSQEAFVTSQWSVSLYATDQLVLTAVQYCCYVCTASLLAATGVNSHDEASI
jgi:hypothetical protein